MAGGGPDGGGRAWAWRRVPRGRFLARVSRAVRGALAVLGVGGEAGQEAVPARRDLDAGDADMTEVQLARLDAAGGELEPQLGPGPLVVPGVRHARPPD